MLTAIQKEEVKKRLVQGLQLIRETGWCQWKLVNEKGAHCLLGVLKRDYDNETFGLSCNALTDVLDIRAGGLLNWNDTPGRTQQEVENLFEKAIITVS